ncbi:MAG: hypothetical protein JWM89_164 [Acidimicrobiales bacterium]|nr:hypothetical protein [Acidimicrobiales bacterium]
MGARWFVEFFGDVPLVTRIEGGQAFSTSDGVAWSETPRRMGLELQGELGAVEVSEAEAMAVFGRQAAST